MKLQISDELSLPLEAVTQTFAILGVRGSGKTNTGVVLFEEMLKAGQQGCVLDPTDAWYGIRSAQDGKSEGFKVYVFGGEHGDLPLTGTAGEGTTMAEFLVETGSSVVFSLRHLSISEQRRFAQEFAERLYELKGKSANRTPLHIFVDEADEFVPQRIPHGFERMFGAYDRLVRRGRSSGMGLTLISQRPQVLNKDVLSQCETLICHRLLHKLDRTAVEAWIEAHDTEGQGDTFMAALASLERGTAWVWSPSWLNVFKQVPVRFRETFDSSFTPKAGEKPKTATRLAEVDLEALKGKLAATIEKVKADDPKELRKKIAELERQLRTVPTQAAPAQQIDIEALSRDVAAAAVAERDKMWGFVAGRFRSAILDQFPQMLLGIEMETPEQFAHTKVFLPASLPRVQTITPPPRREVYPARPMVPPSTNGKLRAGAERMLAALVQWSPEGMMMGQMRSHAGMKKSGTFTTYLSDLRQGGYMEERGGMLYATRAGVDYFGGNVPSAPSSTEEVLAVWEPKLRDGARRILRVLVNRRGHALPLEELAEHSGMTKSGTFTTYLSDLRTARLIVTERGTAAANKETLFL
jgi:hypothetical protein